MEESLGSHLSALPRDVMQNEVVPRIGKLSMNIVRHTLLGHKLDNDCITPDAFQHGMKFFDWCRMNFKIKELGFNIGRFGTPDLTAWALESSIKWCGCPYSQDDHAAWECVLNGAAYEGNMHVLEYVADNKQCIATLRGGLCNIAIDGGQLECLEYLYTLGYKPTHTRYSRRSNRPLELIKWMREIGCEWDYALCYDSALNNDVECLQYAHENGCQWYSSSYDAAAQSGSMNCLKYLHENGCQWSNSVYGIASYYGRLEFLEYLHNNGCLMDARPSVNAADSGKLDCLVWLREHGYPLDVQLSGFYDMMNSIGGYLYNNYPEDPPISPYKFVKLSRGLSLDCLEYLRDIGISWDYRASMGASAVGRLDVLKWLHDNKCKLNKELCISAIEYGRRCMNDKMRNVEHIMHSECLEFLLAH